VIPCTVLRLPRSIYGFFQSLMKNKRTCVPPSICFSCFTWPASNLSTASQRAAHLYCGYTHLQLPPPSSLILGGAILPLFSISTMVLHTLYKSYDFSRLTNRGMSFKAILTKTQQKFYILDQVAPIRAPYPAQGRHPSSIRKKRE
jgi:hypothetical protein